jgi:hypothetical protein
MPHCRKRKSGPFRVLNGHVWSVVRVVLGSADGSRAESECAAANRSPPRRVAPGASPTADRSQRQPKLLSISVWPKFQQSMATLPRRTGLEMLGPGVYPAFAAVALRPSSHLGGAEGGLSPLATRWRAAMRVPTANRRVTKLLRLTVGKCFLFTVPQQSDSIQTRTAILKR